MLTGDGIARDQVVVLGVARPSSAPGSSSASIDPVRQWKLSPTDLASLDRWDDYTAAKEAMFDLTDTTCAPVDGRQEQRQEAGPDRRHALRAQPVRLPQRGRRRRRDARPADRRPGVGGLRARRDAGRSSAARQRGHSVARAPPSPDIWPAGHLASRTFGQPGHFGWPGQFPRRSPEQAGPPGLLRLFWPETLLTRRP